jgi:coenzyme F420-reducing hydrogenase beta subunit
VSVEIPVPQLGFPKIYQVIKNVLCTACGGCEAICPMQAAHVKLYDEANYDKFTPTVEQPGVVKLFSEVSREDNYCSHRQCYVDCVACVVCQNCLACQRICPILDGFPGEDEFDNVIEQRVGKSSLQGQDGAVVTGILKSLFEQGEIDAALSIARNEDWETEVVVLTSAADVSKVGGTKYTYEPLISSLRTALQNYERIAVVGTPCQAHAAALLRENLTDKIKLVIGLICMESFTYDDMGGKIIPDIIGMDFKDIRKLDFHKGKFVAQTAEEKKAVPIKEVAPLARKPCHHCMDYTSYYADISVGSVGSPDGWSTIFIRSQTGKEYMDKTKGIEYDDKPIFMEIVEKLAAQKHKNNEWDYQKFKKVVWAGEEWIPEEEHST